MPKKKTKDDSQKTTKKGKKGTKSGQADIRSALRKLPRKQRAEFVLSYLNARSGGRAQIARASDVWQPFHIRRPTGITSIDIAMGGGFPAGTINQIFGSDGKGKNLVVDHTIAMVQSVYGEDSNIAFASFGQPYQKDFGKKNGVKVGYADAEIEAIRRMLAQEGEELSPDMEAYLREEVGLFSLIDISDDTGAFEKPAESVLGLILDAVKTGEFQLIILDETNLAETRHHAEVALGEDAKVATFATLMTEFLRKFWNAIKFDLLGRPNQTTMIEIMEARVKIGGFSRSGEALEQGGGMALRHSKAIDLHMLGGPQIRIPEVDIPVGREFKWRVGKGKTGCHEGGSGSFQFSFFDRPDGVPYGVDLEWDVIDQAAKAGIVTKAGSWYSYGDLKLGQGLLNAANFLRKKPGLYSELRTKVLKNAGVSRIYRDDPPE